MRSDHDTELGTIFREMRRAMGVSRERIAGRLATPVETIDILESGDLLALPEWSEVTRVVTAYTAQLGLDSRPILRRMQAQISAIEPAGSVDAGVEAAAAPATPPSPPPASMSDPETAAPETHVPGAGFGHAGPAPDDLAPDADFLPDSVTAGSLAAETDKSARAEQIKARLSGPLRTAGSWLLLVGLAGVLAYGLWFASQNPRAVWSAVDSLPDPLPGAMRGAWELVRPLDDSGSRPQVFDPENRKSDKLP